jgi:hypothetical protein
MLSPDIHFFLSTLVLACLLFFPVSRLVWVLSVRRLQGKFARSLDDAAIDGQRVRARVLAVIVSIVFSCFFNAQVLGG